MIIRVIDRDEALKALDSRINDLWAEYYTLWRTKTRNRRHYKYLVTREDYESAKRYSKRGHLEKQRYERAIRSKRQRMYLGYHKVWTAKAYSQSSEILKRIKMLMDIKEEMPNSFAVNRQDEVHCEYDDYGNPEFHTDVKLVDTATLENDEDGSHFKFLCMYRDDGEHVEEITYEFLIPSRR